VNQDQETVFWSVIAVCTIVALVVFLTGMYQSL